MRTIRVPINYDETRKRFEEIHARGAEDFGAAWLVINAAIVEHCQSRIDVSNPAAKELLSLAALRALMRLKSEGYLKSAASKEK